MTANPADAVREALEVMETRWGGYANAKETIRQHIASLESRLAALAGAAPVAWKATTVCYKQFITDAQYQHFSPEVRRWYEPFRCADCRTHAPAKAREDGLAKAAQRLADIAEKNTDDGDAWHAAISDVRAALATFAEGA